MSLVPTAVPHLAGLAAVGGAEAANPALLAVGRWTSYLALVLLVGTTFFLGWLWPRSSVGIVFIRLFYAGGALMVVATVLEVVGGAGSLGGALAGWSGAGQLLRLAVVAVGGGFAWDMLGDARRWRPLVVVWQVLLLATAVLISDAWRAPWPVVTVLATFGHLAATAAWLGGLLALAAILLPSEHLEALDEVLPRFSVVAVVCVVTLVVTGAVHALVVAGSVGALATSTYGAVLLAKVVVFAVMLLLGNVGRRYAARLAHRPVTELDDTAPGRSIHAFAVAVGAEFALAAAVLAVTAVLPQVAPVG